MSGVGGELPKGWVRVRLGDILDRIEAGKSYKCEPRPAGPDEWGVIKVSAMTWGDFDESENKAVPAGYEHNPDYEIKPGDVLLSRANTAAYVGAPVLVKKCRPRLLLSDKSLRLLPANGIDREWLAYLLSSPSVRGQISERATGTKDSMRNISQGALAEIECMLPPLGEQRRIVAVLEQQLSRLKSAQTLLQNTNSRIAHLKTAVAQSLLNPGPCHTGWVAMRIGDIAKVGSGATPHRSRPEYYEGGTIPWVTSSLANRPFIDTAEQFITERALRETAVKLHPPGTLLVAMYGEGKTRGRCTELRISATTNQACASITLLPEHAHKKKWLREFLQASYEKNRRLSAGGVQPNLNLSSIRNIEVHFPDQEAQDQILGDLAEYQDSIARIQNANEVGARRAVMLRRSLLAEAFAGRLAPQDPNDEPAEELLARIRAEREAVAPKKRRTRRAPAQRKATHDEPPPAPAPTNSATPLTGEQPTLDLEFPS
ncbi:restriction endonuclease subunit S [Streptomyces asiaticus]|uniref:restriction endonuclease subunit S n=1 Tax=Streptomyces asiaticus TaxID=114695 RepID=UPI003F67B2E3